MKLLNDSNKGYDKEHLRRKNSPKKQAEELM